ncbi:MAG: class I SAM-dependent methyltransferase, partial [Thermicanus sp.]|nr:class I SAM-dependent methyltransferase [Thermicanus sp.]
RAQKNLEEAGVAHRVTLLRHNASKGLPHSYREKRFDFLFIDAGKDEYETYVNRYLPHLEDGGVIVTDNIFFHGLAFPHHKEDPRNAWIGEKIDRYNHFIFQHPALLTHFLPIGDGMAISIKRS